MNVAKVTMSNKLERRHSRWYEVIVFNDFIQLLVSYSVVVVLPNWVRWGEQLFLWPFNTVQLSTLIINSAAFLLSFIILRKLKAYPGTRVLHYILPTIFLAWLLVVASAMLLQAPYANEVLLGSFGLAMVVAVLAFVMDNDYYKPKLALVPFGRALSLVDCEHGMITVLEAPDLRGRRYNAIVADLHDVNLAPEWQQFLAQCTLAGVPVYHFQQVKEALTGRVQINHLSENIMGGLLPSASYAVLKRTLEILLILLLMPVWLPVMLITGVIVKLESEGPMFFVQNRVGKGNKDFKVYKLRSMTKDSEKAGAQFAKANDMRVTRVGKFIRKTRLDEFPQFINILKGDMSLIGPRPEQRTFVDQFEQEIPFYTYRHVVRPGITGWAQVEHGYAADADDTLVKIEHDFYYIKHFSLWLDLLIVAKTVRTICTGFGAR